MRTILRLSTVDWDLEAPLLLAQAKRNMKTCLSSCGMSTAPSDLSNRFFSKSLLPRGCSAGQLDLHESSVDSAFNKSVQDNEFESAVGSSHVHAAGSIANVLLGKQRQDKNQKCFENFREVRGISKLTDSLDDDDSVVVVGPVAIAASKPPKLAMRKEKEKEKKLTMLQKQQIQNRPKSSYAHLLWQPKG